jgi:hypothetical protein
MYCPGMQPQSPDERTVKLVSHSVQTRLCWALSYSHIPGLHFATQVSCCSLRPALSSIRWRVQACLSGKDLLHQHLGCARQLQCLPVSSRALIALLQAAASSRIRRLFASMTTAGPCWNGRDGVVTVQQRSAARCCLPPLYMSFIEFNSSICQSVNLSICQANGRTD